MLRTMATQAMKGRVRCPDFGFLQGLACSGKETFSGVPKASERDDS